MKHTDFILNEDYILFNTGKCDNIKKHQEPFLTYKGLIKLFNRTNNIYVKEIYKQL